MSENRLVDLYNANEINEFEYRTYLLFELDHAGREFLKKMLELIVLEEPSILSSESITWQDGRRSVWRDIKKAIISVNNAIERSFKKDGTTERSHSTSNPGYNSEWSNLNIGD